MNSLVPSSYLVKYFIIEPVDLRVMSVTALLKKEKNTEEDKKAKARARAAKSRLQNPKPEERQNLWPLPAHEHIVLKWAALLCSPWLRVLQVRFRSPGPHLGFGFCRTTLAFSPAPAEHLGFCAANSDAWGCFGAPSSHQIA